MIVIEESQAAALCFDDVFLMIEPAPNIRGEQARFASYIHELDR
jgi:hypothetical protein